MITIQNYVRAQSLEEAWELNQKKRNRIVGGMLWMKMGRGSVQTAIDLCELGLDTIEESEEQFSIGAMVSLRQLEQHEGLNAYTCGSGDSSRCHTFLLAVEDYARSTWICIHNVVGSEVESEGHLVAIRIGEEVGEAVHA